MKNDLCTHQFVHIECRGQRSFLDHHDKFIPQSWKNVFEKAQELDTLLVPYENERGMQVTREIISGIEKGKSIGIVIGPEGGFADTEIAEVDEAKNMHRISLGRRILRTETAGLATLSMLVYELDE